MNKVGLVSLEAVHTHTHTGNLVINKMNNVIKDREINSY